MSEYYYGEQDAEEKIDLLRIVNDMWKGAKHFYLILILFVILGASSFFLWQYVHYTPLYTAGATFTISKGGSGLYGNTDLLNQKLAAQFADTFPYLLENGILQRKAAKDLGLERLPAEIRTEAVEKTNMIQITVKAEEAKLAYDALRSVIRHYPEVMEPIIGEVVMTPLDEAELPESVSNPPFYARSAARGAGAGIAAGIVFLLLYALLRNTIHEGEDIRKRLNLDCICTVPRVIFKKREKNFDQSVSIYNKKIPHDFLEMMRVLRVRVEKDAEKNNLQTFLLTSTSPGEGKSTIAANLAMALAMRESKVVLIDADLRNPSLRELLGMRKEGAGLYEYLTGKASAEDVIYWDEEYRMYILPGGKPDNDASELLDSLKMRELLEQLKRQADFVIIDTAPAGTMTDAAALAKMTDAALFVVRQDYAGCTAILEALGQLADSKVYLSGCILNGAQAGIGGYGYKNSRYYMRSGYSTGSPLSGK